ncbi:MULTISPECIES: EF-hand domain-containing protein [Burkholderia]|uniref:EF-hand domain-containing protein n=1 Tax=Burkholderia TaxID=32008 RepID=UPI000855BD45|nr:MULTISPECIES: EF-hand domain-containing protein [unclassified Burkholderia]AOK31578.1 hypothetical protein AQ611_18670 [Burkholderia sp. Bp7605]
MNKPHRPTRPRAAPLGDVRRESPPMRRRGLAAGRIHAWALLLCAASACAQTASPAYPPRAAPPNENPERIRIPRDVRPSTQPPLSGPALQRHLRDRYKQRFDNADTDATGRITRDQARRAGWGYVVNHFDEIDAAQTGYVTFDDILHFMQRGGARL